MRYQTHILGGALVGTIICNIYNPDIINSGLIISSSMLGSLLPDIDCKTSYIGNRLKLTSSFVSAFTKHRGITHAPLTAGGLVFLIFFVLNKFININLNIFWGLLTGIMSHILLDSFTVQGIPLFYPITKKKFSFCKITTGKTGELFVFFILLILFIFFLLKLYRL